MPGTPLDITYPTNSSTVKDAIAALIVALQTIQTDIEDKIVPSELSITSGLSMRGYGLSHVGSLIMNPGGSEEGTGDPGQLVYYNGEFYLVTGNGAVQVTDGNSLVAGGADGFYGDYTSSAARATYEDGAGTYSFVDSNGDGAGLIGGWLGLVSSSTGHRMTFLPKSDIGAVATYTWDSPPASGTSVLAVDSSGNLYPASLTDTITNDTKFTGALHAATTLNVGGASALHALGVTGDATVSGEVIAGTLHAGSTVLTSSVSVAGTFTRQEEVGVTQDIKSYDTSTAVTYTTAGGLLAGGTDDIYFRLSGLEVGRRITKFKLRNYKGTGGSTTFVLKSATDGGLSTETTCSAVTTAGTNTSETTCTAPVTVAANKTYFLLFNAAAALDVVYSLVAYTDAV